MTDPMESSLMERSRREACLIHAALFPNHPPAEMILERYEAARLRFFPHDPFAPLVDFLADHKLDPEAVEFAWRLEHGPANGLTQRFQVMLTLCETRSTYDADFVQRRSGTALAWWSAPWLALRAAWKYARGRYLIRTHHLRERVHV